MMKTLSVLAFTAALLLPAANAQAAVISIGGTNLVLVYDPATNSLCDEAGCDAIYFTGDLNDGTILTSLDLEVDGNPVGSVGAPTTDIYVDVALELSPFAPVLGFEAADILGGIIDFYTFGPDGDNFLQLNVLSGGVLYGLGGGTSVTAATANIDLFNQFLVYSGIPISFSDPDITWAFSAPSSTGSTAQGFSTIGGTPDWSDITADFDTPVPEPGSMLLLGSGLMGLAASARRRLRRKEQ